MQTIIVNSKMQIECKKTFLLNSCQNKQKKKAL